MAERQSEQQPDKPDPASGEAPGAERRRGGERRRSVVDRRTEGSGLERRRGPGRRRSDFARGAEEGQLDGEQFLFVMAIDAYKRVNQRPYPSWTEVLEVLRKLGYRKTCSSVANLPNAEDWTEPADAPVFRSSSNPGETTTDRAA